jgi:hypothetical protein
MKKFVIHTPTKKLLNAVLDYAEDQPKLRIDRRSHDQHTYGDKHCVDLYSDDKVTYGDSGFFSGEGYAIIDGEVFLSIAGVDFNNTTTVRLNDKYTAEVDHSAKSVKVGCSSFSFEAIENLHKAISE